jgi:type IV pilus assembly protein PilM
MASVACWGIEVGAGALKAVKLERSGEGVVCTDMAIIPHKRVLSTPDIDEKEAKRVALGTFVSQHDLAGAGIAISVPGHSTFARFAKLPPVEPKKIPDIVKFEAVQQIPFPIDDVEWDYQTFTAPDSPDVEVGIFAMTRDKVMEKLAKWQDVGYTPDTLTLSPLAAYNALAFDMGFTQSTPGTVILDVGTTSSDLIVAEAGRIWIRTFPIGGHHFTEALVTAFNLSYSKAEKLKKEAENTQHTRHVLQAMRPVFGDLAQDVQRSIGYYQSLHRDAKLTRLVGLGNTFALPGLRKFLSQQLQIEVNRLESFARVRYEGVGGADREKEFQENSVLLATAVGCALQGLGMQTVSANLMPVQVARAAMWNRKTRWFVAAAAVAVAAGGVSFVRPVIDKATVDSKPLSPEVASTRTQAKALKAKWSAVESEAKQDFRAGNAIGALDRRDVYAHLTKDIATLFEQTVRKTEALPPLAKSAGAAAEEKPFPKVVLNGVETDYQWVVGNVEFQPGQPPPAEGESKPRLRCKVRISIARPQREGELVVNEVTKAWFAERKADKDAPYTIVEDKQPWQRDTPAVRTIEDSNKQGGGVGNTPPASQPAGEAEPARPTRPPQPTGRPQPPGTPRRPVPGGEREPATPPSQLAPGEVGGGSFGGGGPKSNDDMQKLAPLPFNDFEGPPGTVISQFIITFEAVLKPVDGEKKEEQK